MEIVKYLPFFPLTFHRGGCCWPVHQNRSWVFCFCRVPALCWCRGTNRGQLGLGLIQISIAVCISEKQYSWVSQVFWCIWELLSFLS